MHCRHNSILTCRIAGSVFLPQHSKWSIPQQRWAKDLKIQWKRVRQTFLSLVVMWWFSSTFLTCTSGSPRPWSTDLLHTLICIRDACCCCLPGQLQPQRPSPGVPLLLYIATSPWPSLKSTAALSELWWWCCMDAGADGGITLFLQERWTAVSVCFSGYLTTWVRRHRCAWSAWRQRAAVVELQYRQRIFPFYCYFPNRYFIFCLGGLQLLYLFILLFAFRASLCLFSTISLFSFSSPSGFICNLHFNLAWLLSSCPL